MKFLKLSGTQKDLGGLQVSRLLPQMHLHTAGPFVFLDHMGPSHHPAGPGMNVRPHPHIGLATVTYLFEGKIHHKDSLGSSQEIAPGDVNWMIAGSGIVHSERTPTSLQASGQTLHGLQMWVALPAAQEDCAPSFQHHPASELPIWTEQLHQLRLIIGTAFGKASPVQVHSNLFYLDVAMINAHPLRFEHFLTFPSPVTRPVSLAIYPIQGQIKLELPDRFKKTFSVTDHTLAPLSDEPNPWILSPNQIGCFQLSPDLALDFFKHFHLFSLDHNLPCHCVLFGGEEFPEYRHITWNFVSSSKTKIEDAKKRWQDQTMGQVPGETEFIPFPS